MRANFIHNETMKLVQNKLQLTFNAFVRSEFHVEPSLSLITELGLTPAQVREGDVQHVHPVHLRRLDHPLGVLLGARHRSGFVHHILQTGSSTSSDTQHKMVWIMSVHLTKGDWGQGCDSRSVINDKGSESYTRRGGEGS